MSEYLFNLGPVDNADDVDGVVTVKPNLWLLSSEELPPLLLTVEDVARVLHIGRDKVFQLMREKKLRSIKVGASRRVTARALADYVAGLEAVEPA